MQPAKQLEYKSDPNKFDLRTHVWDSQGHLVSKNLYRLYIVNGNSLYERPVNSGNLWTEGNQPAGRVELTFGPTGKIASKEFKADAAHREYTAPLMGAEKVHYELEQERGRVAALEAELAAIKKEREVIRAVQDGVPAAPKVAAPMKPAAPTLPKKDGAL